MLTTIFTAVSTLQMVFFSKHDIPFLRVVVLVFIQLIDFRKFFHELLSKITKEIRKESFVRFAVWN